MIFLPLVILKENDFFLIAAKKLAALAASFESS
jgi:hypothetical protein